MSDIPQFLDRRPLVFSYTFLNTYQSVCPHQAAQRYIYKTTPYIETPEMRFGNEVHSAFEHRIAGGKPLPVEMQKWEPFAAPFDGLNAKTELKVAINRNGHPTKFFDDDVWLRGKLDTIVMKDAAGYMADWKTGNSKYEDPFELQVGALMLRATYPHLTTIKGQYAWLKENRMSAVYDLSDVLKTWNTVHSITTSIERDKQAGTFEKRKGPLCSWCNVWNCENNNNSKKPI